MRTHQDVINIAASLYSARSRAEITEELLSRHGSVANNNFAIDASIDLVVRLLLMVEVGEFECAFRGESRTRLVWTDGPLTNFLLDVFPNTPKFGHEGVKLSKIFNARNLDRIGDYKIEFTANLKDHLRLRDDDMTVCIFSHATFLRRQINNKLYPDSLITETLQTLSILFPPHSKSIKRWYKKAVRSDDSTSDMEVLSCGSAPQRIEHYVYWHDRLVMIKDAFDESRPSTLKQWWNDRREGLQWYGLWVAIAFTVLFGLVQSIEGAFQAWKAYHSSK
jgi:hypothetical protein